MCVDPDETGWMMEFSNSLLILKIIFILLQCPRCTNATCSAKEYNLLPGGHNVFIKNGVQPVFNEMSATDKNTCMQMCVNERFCHVWRFDNHQNCQIFHSMKDEITVGKSRSVSMTTYYETAEGEKWHEIYYIKSESGFAVYSSFLAIGTYESWGPASCTRVFCPDLFRSNLIDVWNKLPVTKVKFSLFKNNTEIRLIFDGQKTTSKNWFSMSRVLESPWKDVHKGAIFDFFGLNYKSLRSFHISQHNIDCANDLGWIVIAESKNGCKWEDHPNHPYIMYSHKNTATKWQEEYATADSLSIYMSF